MDAEAIVRALAALPAPCDSEYGDCTLCLDSAPKPYADVVHKPDCPWRLAREWVAEHPEGTTERRSLSLPEISDWLKRFSW